MGYNMFKDILNRVVLRIKKKKVLYSIILIEYIIAFWIIFYYTKQLLA
jgi:hypothetical protein